MPARMPLLWLHPAPRAGWAGEAAGQRARGPRLALFLHPRAVFLIPTLRVHRWPGSGEGKRSQTVRREAGADEGTLARRSPTNRSRYGLHARCPRRFALARTRRRDPDAPPPGSQQHPSASGSGEKGKGK